MSARVTTRAVLAAVARHYDISIAELRSNRRRNATAVRARAVAMYLARNVGRSSFPAIARDMGGRHHTTIMDGCERAVRLMRDDGRLRLDVDQLKTRLLGAPMDPAPSRFGTEASP